MKYQFPVIALLILLTGTSELRAQNSQQAEINITATVRESEIEINTLQPMNLTNAERVEGIVTLDPVLNANAGKMLALGNTGSRFRITFDRVRELTNVSGQGVIFIEYAVSGNPLDEQESSELFDEESRELVFSSEGHYYFWIGGRIDLSQATTGTYAGEFTLEIEYL